jgi:hypothetical protein
MEVGQSMTEAFEAALAATERGVDSALRSAGAATRELRKALVGARSGQVRDLRRALAAAESAANALVDEARAARAGFDFDEQSYLADGRYAKELLAMAATSGVTMFEEDERLLCYPSLVKVIPGDAAVEIDKTRERRLRPSVLVRLLGDRQGRAPRFKADAFLESLGSAYELVVTRDGKKADAVVRLIDLWAVLTMLPGQAREYTKQEFARDLYLLDQAGATRTRAGRVLRWSASTGTKGTGVLTTVARGGQQQRYWGVSFSASEVGP